MLTQFVMRDSFTLQKRSNACHVILSSQIASHVPRTAASALVAVSGTNWSQIDASHAQPTKAPLDNVYSHVKALKLSATMAMMSMEMDAQKIVKLKQVSGAIRKQVVRGCLWTSRD